jgi:broad specificity phosphatase PhoE
MLAAGRALPEPTRVPELDEHDGIGLMFKMLPELAQSDDSLRSLALSLGRGERPVAEMLAVFRRITRRWARGEINHAEVESWSQFRARVERGLATMTKDAAQGERLVAFTSGGTVAAAVGLAVGANDEKVLDMSWALYNGALTEIAFSDRGCGLVAFNATPHLRDAKLVTSV